MGSLFTTLIQPEHLKAAWMDIKTKKAAGGIDGESLSSFEIELERNIRKLSDDLATGTWSPQPYKQVAIPKKKTEKRLLGMLSIRDKIVQQAIRMLIEPPAEKMFFPCSYGYRPGKGAIPAIKKVKRIQEENVEGYVLRLDIDDFFDTLDHSILEKRLKGICPDEEVRRLVMLCVQMGAVTGKMKWKDSSRGVPQGAVLSPLLANLYMHSFDQFILNRTERHVRYADDFIIFGKDKEEAESLLQLASGYLKEKLMLTLNPPIISSIDDGFEFLGITFGKEGVGLSSQKKEQLLAHISEIRLTPHGLDRLGEKRWSAISSYYGKLLPQTVLQELDQVFFNRLGKSIEENIKDFPNKNVLANALKDIPFVTKDFREHQSSIKEILVERYLEKKKSTPEEEARKENRKIILQRKHEYRKKENAHSEVIINKPGMFVGIAKNQLTIKDKGVLLKAIPLGNLKHLIVTAEGVGFSGSLLFHLLQNRIPFDFFSRNGKHLGSFLSAQSQQCLHWREQAGCPIEKRNRLGAQMIEGKLTNQMNLVKYFHKYHKNRYSLLDPLMKDLELHVQRFRSYLGRADYKDKDWAKTIMGYEAQGALKYWAYLREMLRDSGAGFEGRVQQGATDIVNSLLNYGYAVLYTRVWQAILQAQLNPYDSIIHARQAGKPTFVFDVIELFRAQAVDRVVIALVQKKEPIAVKGGFLTDESKGLLMKNLTERMQKREKYRGTEVSFEDIIKKQTAEIAHFFQEDAKYLPYKAKW